MKEGLTKLALGLVLVLGAALLASCGGAQPLSDQASSKVGPKIRTTGGGDDQPPIIISDGSAILLTLGDWTMKGPHFVLNDNVPNATANTFKVNVSNGTCNPDYLFNTDELELHLGSGSSADNYSLQINGAGKVSIDFKANKGHAINGGRADLGDKGISLSSLTDKAAQYTCTFDSSIHPFIVVTPTTK